MDGTTVTYEYAGDDLRTERSVAGGATETLLWDRQAGLPELVDDGTNIYLQFGDGELAEIGSSGDAVYPLADALGSSRALTSETGAVLGTADWDVWGNARSSAGSQAGMGWTGELRDSATGLTYLRARDYSPGGGRFLQRDTVSPNGPGSQGYNPYAYAAGNPATHTDPSGHSVGGASSTTAGMILGILDFSVLIQAIVSLFKPARELLRIANTLPPVIRTLVMAILNFVIALFINLLVMMIISIAMAILGAVVGKTLHGAGLVLIRFLKIFYESAKIMRVCSQPGALGFACRNLHKWFPKLPSLLNNPCVRSILEELGFALAGALAGDEDFGVEGGAVALGWAASACISIKPPMISGRVAILLNGQRAIDTSTFLKKGKPTKYEGIRNNREFFDRWNQEFPETLSPENRKLIMVEHKNPVVDEHWVQYYPDHKEYMGRTLVHHHHEQGPVAYPMPDQMHWANTKDLHNY